MAPKRQSVSSPLKTPRTPASSTYSNNISSKSKINFDCNEICATKVFLRVRPFNNKESGESEGGKLTSTFRVDDSNSAYITTLDPFRKYAPKDTYVFERCFDHAVVAKPKKGHQDPSDERISSNVGKDQEAIYTSVGRPVLQNAIDGYNGCVFAYGQTGSGKTYTMMGPPDVLDAIPTTGRKGHKSTAPILDGIIPRLARDLFVELHNMREKDSSHSFRVELEYFEIYNEKVMDLLNPSAPNEELRVRNSARGPYVEGLVRKHVKDEHAVMKWLKYGNCERHTACTNMNDRSSRSHAILTLHLVQMRLVDDDTGSKMTSKLNLVDLAGSERTGASGVVGKHFKEATKINLSLTTLGRVIDALADISQGRHGVFCPYRDSNLTWLLADSLGGNSKTTMVATVSPHFTNFDESCQTLRYASRAKQIVTKVVVNEDPQARQIKMLTAEVKRLQDLLSGDEDRAKDEYLDELHERLSSLEAELQDKEMELQRARAQLAAMRQSRQSALLDDRRSSPRASEMIMEDIEKLKEDNDHLADVEQEVRDYKVRLQETEKKFAQVVRHAEKECKLHETIISRLQSDNKESEGLKERLRVAQEDLVAAEGREANLLDLLREEERKTTFFSIPSLKATARVDSGHNYTLPVQLSRSAVQKLQTIQVPAAESKVVHMGPLIEDLVNRVVAEQEDAKNSLDSHLTLVRQHFDVLDGIVKAGSRKRSANNNKSASGSPLLSSGLTKQEKTNYPTTELQRLLAEHAEWMSEQMERMDSEREGLRRQITQENAKTASLRVDLTKAQENAESAAVAQIRGLTESVASAVAIGLVSLQTHEAALRREISHNEAATRHELLLQNDQEQLAASLHSTQAELRFSRQNTEHALEQQARQLTEERNLELLELGSMHRRVVGRLDSYYHDFDVVMWEAIGERDRAFEEAVRSLHNANSTEMNSTLHELASLKQLHEASVQKLGKDLKDALITRTAEAEAFTKEIEHMKSAAQASEEKRSKMEEEIGQLRGKQRQLVAMQKCVDEWHSIHQQYSEKHLWHAIREMTNVFNEAVASVQAHRAQELRDVSANLSQLKKSSEAATQKYEKDLKDAAITRTAEAEAFTKEIEHMKSAAQASEEKRSKMEEEIGQLRGKQRQLVAMQKCVDEWHSIHQQCSEKMLWQAFGQMSNAYHEAAASVQQAHVEKLRAAEQNTASLFDAQEQEKQQHSAEVSRLTSQHLSQISDLEQRVALLNTNSASMEAQLEAQAADVHDLQDQLKASIEELEAEKQQHGHETDSLEGLIKEGKEQLATVEQQHVEALRAAEYDKATALANAAKELSSVESRMKSQQEDFDERCTSLQSTIDAATAEVADLRQKLHVTTAEQEMTAASLQDEREARAAQDDQIRQHDETIEGLRGELATTTASLTRAECSAEKLSEHLAVLKEEKEQLQHELSGIQKELEAASCARAELEVAASASLASFEATKQQLEAEQASLVEKLHVEERKREEVQVQMQQDQEKHANLVVEHETLVKTLSQRDEELANSKDAHSDTLAQLQNTQKEVETLTGQLQVAHTATKEAADAHKAEALSWKQSMETLAAEHQEELDAWMVKDHAAHAELVARDAAMQKLATTIASQSVELAQARQETVEVQQKKQLADEKHQQARDEWKRLESDMRLQLEESSESTARVLAELETVKKDRDSAAQRSAELSDALDAVKSRLHALKKKQRKGAGEVVKEANLPSLKKASPQMEDLLHDVQDIMVRQDAESSALMEEKDALADELHATKELLVKKQYELVAAQEEAEERAAVAKDDLERQQEAMTLQQDEHEEMMAAQREAYNEAQKQSSDAVQALQEQLTSSQDEAARVSAELAALKAKHAAEQLEWKTSLSKKDVELDQLRQDLEFNLTLDETQADLNAVPQAATNPVPASAGSRLARTISSFSSVFQRSNSTSGVVGSNSATHNGMPPRGGSLAANLAARGGGLSRNSSFSMESIPFLPKPATPTTGELRFHDLLSNTPTRPPRGGGVSSPMAGTISRSMLRAQGSTGMRTPKVMSDDENDYFPKPTRMTQEPRRRSPDPVPLHQCGLNVRSTNSKTPIFPSRQRTESQA